MAIPDADRLARGALLQQGAQIVRMAGGLLVLTVLARKLSLAELGTYTLLLSLITYVQFVKASVMNAAVVGVAEAGEDREAVGRVVSTGFVVYGVLGAAAGVLLAAIGLAALPILNVPEGLEGSAQAGVVGLALVTAAGWPAQIFDDLMRGQQRFAAVSAMEIAGMVAYVGGALALVVADAEVWLLVTWSAAIPLLTGVLCFFAVIWLAVPVTFSRHLVLRSQARRFGRISSLLLLSGVAELAIFSLDRAILSAIRSPATVGRYEGPLQMQNSIRYLHGVLSAPVVPAAVRYLADDDAPRLRELFLRGLRYTLAITLPFAVVLTIQAEPIMTAWLGDKFATVGGAASLFCAWWLIGANTGMATTMLMGAQRFAFIARISWIVAAVNVAITLALTPKLGLWGPIAGAIAAFSIALALSLPAAMGIARASVRDTARTAWIPTYSIAAVVAGALLLARELVDLSGGAAAIASLVVVPLVYWALFALVWMDADERALAWRTVRFRRVKAAR